MDYYWIVFVVVLLAYFDLKASIKRVLNNQSKNIKKDFSFLEQLKGKEIEIEVNDEDVVLFDASKKGTLKDFNDVWLILEIATKKGKELVYYRIANIKGVLEIKNNN